MRSVLGLIFGLSLVASASAEVPQQLHYNGYLTNAVGDPVDCPDAIQCGDSFEMSFRLYSQEEGGSPSWVELVANVPIYGGSFHVTLGDGIPLTPELFDGPVWLALKINDNAEMLPRQKVLSAAYALRAGTVDYAENAAQLGGLNPEDFASTESVTELQTIIAGTDDDTLAALVCTEGQVAKWDGSAWACADDIDTDTTIEDTNTQLSETEVDTMVANNGYAAQSELEAAQTALTELQTLVNNIDTSTGVDITALQNQITALETAIASAQTDLAAEATARETADNAEATARAAKDIELENALNAETTTRTDGDLTLQGDINTVQANIVALDSTLGAISKASLECTEGQIAVKSGATWVCNEPNQGGVGVVPPKPCDESSIGQMYYDLEAKVLRLCDGTLYRQINTCTGLCPDASTLGCGLTIENDCGISCGVAGTALNELQCSAETHACGIPHYDDCSNECPTPGSGLNPLQCDEPSTVACGETINDDCGNLCAQTGSGLNLAQCDSSSIPCGGTVFDSCGNECPDTGTGLNTEQCADVASLDCGEVGTDTCGNSCASTGICTEMFFHTGNAQLWTVPPGITTISVKLWGAGGGNGNHAGGDGHFVSGELTVVPMEVLNFMVGGAGKKSQVPTYGGGGLCGQNCGGGGSGGGGRSAIQRSGQDIVTAGGGGGGGLTGSGGSADWPNGQNGSSAGGFQAQGGTQTHGGSGAGGDGGDGSKFQGGNSPHVHAGGGGGGWYGGGSGTGQNNTDISGAGGSSFIDNLINPQTDDCNGDPESLDGFGCAGQPGRILIRY